WPLTARTQQPAMPMIGFMITNVQSRSQQIAAFHAGLKESGYVEGQNVRVELRSAEGHFDSLSSRRRGDRMTECPLLAHSGHMFCTAECPLSGVKPTWRVRCKMPAFDP